jgi:Fe-S cluster assembly ATP-binding protein
MREDPASKDTGFLIITHYPRILQHVAADAVHIMLDGRIVKEGGPELAHTIEREGYDALREVAGAGV